MESEPEKFEVRTDEDITRAVELARNSVGNKQKFEFRDSQEGEVQQYSWSEDNNQYLVQVVHTHNPGMEDTVRIIGAKIEFADHTSPTATSYTYKLVVNNGRFLVGREQLNVYEDTKEDPLQWSEERLAIKSNVELMEFDLGLMRPDTYDWEDFLILLGQARTAKALL